MASANQQDEDEDEDGDEDEDVAGRRARVGAGIVERCASRR